MEDREILSVLKYVASVKPRFLLSEIQQYLSEEIPVASIHSRISSYLDDLHLSSEKIGADYSMGRIGIADTLQLTGEEHRRILAALGSRQFPEELQDRIQQYIAKKVGKSLLDPVVLERIRRAIVAQKSEYWKESKGITYRKGYSVFGYLVYHAPVYYTQFQHILLQMAEGGLFKTRMRILDVGTGPGVVPLAIAGFLKILGRGEAHIFAIDRFEENLEAYRYMVPDFGRDVLGLRIEQPQLTDMIALQDIPDHLDMLVFSMVLNELKISPEQRAKLVLRYAERLAHDGTVVIVEPADLVNATEMRRTVVHLLDQGLFMYAPCTFLWGTRCHPVSCWSFAEKESIHPTRLMLAVAGTHEPHRYINTDIKYSYALLRKDSTTREVYRAQPHARFARLSKLSQHLKRRINVVVAVMSSDLGDADHYIYKVCDGTAGKSVYAILPRHHEAAENAALRESRYGEVVEIYNVLVRYNPKHDAYNLLVDRNTEVLPVSGRFSPDLA